MFGRLTDFNIALIMTMTNVMMRQRKYLFIVSEGKAIQMFCIRVSSTKAIKEAKANDPLDFDTFTLVFV